jgi:2-C-methyl-D-erythritol 4-phosphate cytidylyltransferase
MIAWGVLVAGGGGTRFGRPKQFEALGDRRVLDWSLAALTAACRGVVVVLPAGATGTAGLPPGVVAVPGGNTRSASVRAGLAAVAADATHVLVHDAARPLASSALVGRVLNALASGAVAVVPVVPVIDSLRTADGRPVDRSRLLAVQTPQGFDLTVLREAHRLDSIATDDATLVDQLGLPVVHVAGEPTNLKLTEPHDLAMARALLDTSCVSGALTGSGGRSRA